MKKPILLLILLANAFFGNCQQPVNYSPQQLRDDYALLQKTLETTYPSLYRFTDSAIMTQYLADQYRSIGRPESEKEFYKLIATTCARINDEHLIAQPSKDYYHSLASAHHYFPFSLKILDRRFYVIKTAQAGGPIPIGAEIISINGRSAEDILQLLTPSIPSDGYGQSANIRHLEDYSMTEEDSFFDLNYPIFVEDTNTFRIEYIDLSDRSKIKITTIAGLNFKSYKNFFYGRNPLKAPLELKYLVKDIAYLRISSFLGWHRRRFRQDFDQLYDSVFTALRKNHTKNLILDLRNNEGGDGSGEKLLTYLLTKPYRLYASAEMKYTGYPAVVDQLQDKKEDLFFPDSLFEPTNTGLYRFKETHLPFPAGEQQPDKNHFQGNLYVLINGGTGSMAAVVSSFLKGNRRGVFIGEESGGAMEGATARYGATLVLPNTKIRVGLGLVRSTRAVSFTKGRGVEPDYVVEPKIAELLKGTDTELNFTIGLITAKK